MKIIKTLNKSIDYYMGLARAAAIRSTCLDKHVGAIAVDKQGHVIGTGYNGPPRKVQHCTQCHAHEFGGICHAVHAEQNALLHSDTDKIAVMYVTLEPCMTCTRMLMNTPCEVIIFGKETNPRKSGRSLWAGVNGPDTWILYNPE